MNFNDFIEIEQTKDYFIKLKNELALERQKYTIFPDEEDVFNAFKLTSLDDVKILLLGQDPYHGFGQAHGLSFSVKKGVKIPPSLRNIFKELHSSLDFDIPKNGDLTEWAKRGMLLLNATLTVREASANSHAKLGWEEFSDNAIKFVSDNKENVCFILLGNYAKTKASLIDESKHKIILGVHPSPLSASRGFLGSGIFLEVQKYIEEKYNQEFDFSLGDSLL